MAMRSEIRHFHLFCGLGGAARGMNAGEAKVGQFEAAFRCIGGVDSDRAAVRDFERLAEAPGTVLDLFSREQYVAFHGKEPHESWREATPDDLRQAAGGERPHIVFTSPPCKGFSGLLSETRSKGAKYQALNGLTIRGVFLALTAWEDDPPEFFILENVPRIATRGRHLLDEIRALLEVHGYSVAETTHDCGEIGGLGQRRRRFLMVARHREKVPPFLYEPPRRPLKSVGEVIGGFPMPEDLDAGPMHALPRLHWKTWLRLALVEAGSDWRSLERLRVVDGHLADFAIMPEIEWHHGVLGVTPWDQPSCTVTGRSGANTGAFSVADPRVDGHERSVQLGVRPWDQPAAVVTCKMAVGGGPHAVADPRLACDAEDRQTRRFNNLFRVIPWDREAQAVTGGFGPTSGGQAIADPRVSDSRHYQRYGVTPWAEPRGTVTGARSPGQGFNAIADPRIAAAKRDGEPWAGARHYGVVPWSGPSQAVLGAARHDNGSFNVADPRLPESTDRLVAVIRALDGTWHRPFSTLELAALQGLVTPEEHLELDGEAHSHWRERIGNAVPSPAAAAVASVMGRALLLAWSGETFALGCTPIWARRLAVAAAVEGR